MYALNNSRVKYLKKYRMSLEEDFILHCLAQGSEDYIDLKADKKKSFNSLVRRKFITKTLDITDLGQKILNQEEFKTDIFTKGTPVKKSNYSEQFKKLWDAYPASDKWGSFPRTRGMRNAEMDCYKIFVKIIENQDAAVEELISVINWEVSQRQKSSRAGKNELSYMPNFKRYLAEGFWKEGLEMIRSKPPVEEQGNKPKRFGGELH